MNGLTPQEERIFGLERTIAAFKKYDAGRKNYIAEQNRVIEKLRQRVAALEKLTEQQHEQIDDLIDAYDKANGMIDNAANKAYVKELLDKITLYRESTSIPQQWLDDEDTSAMLKELTALRNGAVTMRTTIKRLKVENELLKKNNSYDTN